MAGNTAKVKLAVKRLREEHPDWSSQEIAEELKIDRQRVYNFLRYLGLSTTPSDHAPSHTLQFDSRSYTEMKALARFNGLSVTEWLTRACLRQLEFEKETLRS